MEEINLLRIADEKLLKVTERPDLVMERGEGMYLYDTKNNRYLDFIGGWATNCLGHCPRILVESLCRQAGQLVNASPSLYNRPMLEYADMLLSNCCFDRVFFASTGAEVNEGAIKLARKYGTKRKNGAFEIITTWQAFHGRTLATMAATGKKQWEQLFEPKPGGFVRADFNNLDSVARKVTPSTCAIMVEPIQGEGGVHVATPEFIEGLRAICNKEDVLLIFDEVQTGMGRTGSLFCYEHYSVEPDIMTLGKGLGGGFPLAAMLCKEACNIFDPGDQGGTYTGQPLAMAAGRAVLSELLDKQLAYRAGRMGSLLIGKLEEISAYTEVCEIRGKGLLIAFDLKASSAFEIVKKCLMDGLIINATGPATIRLIPPLIVSEADIELMLEILLKHLQRC